MKRELGIGKCGLACCLCSENVTCHGCASGECSGVKWCFNYKCANQKGITNCYKCDKSDCQEGLLKKIKPRAFNLFIKRYGEEELLNCLERNEKNGIIYHVSGVEGDYDNFDDVEKLISFIKTGVR